MEEWAGSVLVKRQLDSVRLLKHFALWFNFILLGFTGWQLLVPTAVIHMCTLKKKISFLPFFLPRLRVWSEDINTSIEGPSLVSSLLPAGKWGRQPRWQGRREKGRNRYCLVNLEMVWKLGLKPWIQTYEFYRIVSDIRSECLTSSLLVKYLDVDS